MIRKTILCFCAFLWLSLLCYDDANVDYYPATYNPGFISH
jgi:hypothetical protein